MEHTQIGNTQRVTISSSDPKPTNPQDGPQPARATASWKGGVQSITYTRDADNRPVVQMREMPRGQHGGTQPLPTAEPSAQHDAPSEDILATARSPWGNKGVTDKSIVTVMGIEMPINIAVRQGYLARRANGEFYQPGREASAPAQQQQAAQPHQEQQQQAPVVQDKAPDLQPETQKYITELTQKVDNVAVTKAVREAVNGEPLSNESKSALATQLGVEPQEVERRLGALQHEFTQQATDLTASHAGTREAANDVFTWARENAPHLLRDAINDHVNFEKGSGYQKLTQAYLEALPQHFPEAILNSPDAKARDVKRDAKTGQITIAYPGVGRIEWTVAVRRGLIAPRWKA